MITREEARARGMMNWKDFPPASPVPEEATEIPEEKKEEPKEVYTKESLAKKSKRQLTAIADGLGLKFSPDAKDIPDIVEMILAAQAAEQAQK